MSETLSLTVKNSHDELDYIVSTLEDMAEREQWPPELVYRVNLVVEELVLNVMDYGYDAGIHDIEINLASEEDSLTIEIVDSGKPFDPLTEAPEPDLEASIEDRRVGGLGVYLVRTMMDQMHYKRENEKNHLTIVARRA